MDLQLKGKKAIVTGGSAGIGFAVARVLAEEGVEVTIPGRSREKLEQAIASLGGAVRGVETDLGTAEGARRLIEAVPDTDILVNNLGIYESKNFVDISDGDWLRFFEINLLGGIRLARHYFPGMLRRNWGRVIFVSSEAGAETHPDMIHYGVTKTGQVVVARGLAEMTKGTGVTVNSILPGPTRSEANDVFVQSMASTPNATFEQVLEQLSPRLCADRVDYFLRDSLALGILTQAQASQLSGSLVVADRRFAVRNLDAARLFGYKYMEADESSWSNKTAILLYELTARALRTALDRSVITEIDFWGGDIQLWDKISQSTDCSVAAGVKLMLRYRDFVEDESTPTVRLQPKIRTIDPDVLTDDGMLPMSQLDAEFRSDRDDYLKRRASPISLRLAD